MLFSSSAMAIAPPVEVALQAVGEQADERRGGSWSMTRVDDGVATLCADDLSKEQGMSFSGDERQISVDGDAETPWNLVWALLWSSSPDERLGTYIGDWGDSTSRVEVFDGAPAYCYGEASKLCVDYELGYAVLLELEIDDVTWRLRTRRESSRLQISADGSQVARISANDC